MNTSIKILICSSKKQDEGAPVALSATNIIDWSVT